MDPSPTEGCVAAPQPTVYSPEQQRVIAHREGHLQVVACAGSGKTETVAMRVATLLSEGVAPRAIIAFTFTRLAAEGLKTRILRKVQQLSPTRNLDELSPMFVGTLHAWCLRFLQERVARYATFDLANEHRLVGLLTREYDVVGLAQLGIESKVGAIQSFIKTADVVENEMLPSEALPAGPFRDVFERYLALLDRYHILTFNQATALAVAELAKADVLHNVHHDLRHLIVDEFQDINPAQAALIRRLGAGPVSVCVVGDDDQAIYQWRGSSVDYIRTFQTEFAAHRETLGVNRRSRASIVTTAAKFAATIPHRIDKVVTASRDDDPHAVTAFVAKDARREAEHIADAIVTLRAAGVPYRQVALLFRAMTSTTPFLQAFEARGIPYRCEGRSGLFRQPEAELLAEVFAWLAGRTTFWTARDEVEKPLTLDALLPRLQSLFGLDAHRLDGVGKLLFVFQKALPKLEEADLVGTYYRLLNVFNVHTWDTDDPEVTRRLGVLGRFSELLADYESVTRRAYREVDPDGARSVHPGFAGGERFIDKLVDYIDYYARSEYQDFTGEPDFDQDAVTLSTIHAAKGLEWPVVFVPCLSANRFPSYFTGKQQPWLVPRSLFPASRYEGTDEDERRLFYVAITRARDHLYLSTHQRVTSQSAAPSPYFTLAAGPSAPLVTAAPWTPTQLPAHPHGAGDKPTFSFSELAQYQSCPLQYRFRQNLGFQPQAAKELGYGRAVHHVLRRLAEHVRQHGDVPSLLGFEQLFDREFYLPYADRSAWETMEARARTVVTHYLTHFRADLDRVWEVERSFELHLDSANVVGRADVILDREDGLPGGLALVDYKTRSVAKVDEAMALQLQVYTAAARGEGYDVRAAWLHDLTAPKAAARVTVASTPDVVLIATHALTALARGVRDRSFPAQPGDGCRYCDVRPLCRHARTQ